MTLKGLGLRLLQTAHRASLASARRRFAHALTHCETVQASRLRALVTGNASSAYGRAHGFDRIGSVRDWQHRVPVVDFDALQPWVQRAAGGEAGVLTAAPVLAFERTSGSSAPNKLVPYTAALLQEFSAATGPWLSDLYTAFPALLGTTSYWSISPAARQAERTTGGIPIGFDDDTEYFGPLQRFALRRMMAVPAEVARIPRLDAWADATARHLVADEHLGLISVWHPSFFGLLLDRIERRLDDLLREVSPRRAAAIRTRRETMTMGEALWPRLTIVSCWADAAAAGAVPALARALPHAYVQPKGLLATEGVVSFPLQAAGASEPSTALRPGPSTALGPGEGSPHQRSIGVAAVAGHFLEFLDLDRPAAIPRLAHELSAGADYAPVISTGGGFYRYRLGDAVRCTGFHHRAPILRFEGRIDQVTDLCGEKLNPRLVAAAIGAAEQSAGVAFAFALVAPAAGSPPAYCFYAEGPSPAAIAAAGDRVERILMESHGYRYARALGQLGPLRTVAVHDGAARYLRARAAAGQRAGQIKPSHLDASLEWTTVFPPSLDQAPASFGEAGPPSLDQAPASFGEAGPPSLDQAPASFGEASPPSLDQAPASFGEAGPPSLDQAPASFGEAGPPPLDQAPASFGEAGPPSLDQAPASFGEAGPPSLDQAPASLGEAGPPSLDQAPASFGEAGPPSLDQAPASLGEAIVEEMTS